MHTFKVGDRVRHRQSGGIGLVDHIFDAHTSTNPKESHPDLYQVWTETPTWWARGTGSNPLYREEELELYPIWEDVRVMPTGRTYVDGTPIEYLLIGRSRLSTVEVWSDTRASPFRAVASITQKDLETVMKAFPPDHLAVWARPGVAVQDSCSENIYPLDLQQWNHLRGLP